MDQQLQLIITADDFGYSSQRNLAITGKSVRFFLGKNVLKHCPIDDFVTRSHNLMSHLDGHEITAPAHRT